MLTGLLLTNTPQTILCWSSLHFVFYRDLVSSVPDIAFPSTIKDGVTPTTPTQVDTDFEILAQEVGNFTDSHIDIMKIKDLRATVRKTGNVLSNNAMFSGACVYFMRDQAIRTPVPLTSGGSPKMARLLSASTSTPSKTFLGLFNFIDDQECYDLIFGSKPLSLHLTTPQHGVK